MKKILITLLLLGSFEIHAQMEKAKCIELVQFQFNPGYSLESEAAGLKELSKFIQNQKGFVERVSARNEEGVYYDIVYWETKEDAIKASESAMQSPICIGVFEMMDLKTIKMQHLELVN